MNIIEEMIEVLQAFQEGKSIEYRSHSNDIWLPARTPAWQFKNHEYRIKPKEKKKVSMWQWLYSNKPFSGNDKYLYSTTLFFRNFEDAKKYADACEIEIMHRLDHTEIEVEE